MSFLVGVMRLVDGLAGNEWFGFLFYMAEGSMMAYGVLCVIGRLISGVLVDLGVRGSCGHGAISLVFCF